jgi:hypothetical protein
MDKFWPVSIRMAKDQSLSLNPTKISGQCGRLMCCLTYEHVIYQGTACRDKSTTGEDSPEISDIERIPEEEYYEKVVFNNNTTDNGTH